MSFVVWWLEPEVFEMTQETFDGIFYRRGIAGDPVVFIEAPDHARFNQWFSANSIFTQIFRHPHPNNIRPERRGNGVKVVSVV